MKKSIGIVRKLDALGRVTIPKELRKTLCIQEEDDVEILAQADGIFIRKYTQDTTPELTALLQQVPQEKIHLVYKLAAELVEG